MAAAAITGVAAFTAPQAVANPPTAPTALVAPPGTSTPAMPRQPATPPSGLTITEHRPTAETVPRPQQTTPSSGGRSDAAASAAGGAASNAGADAPPAGVEDPDPAPAPTPGPGGEDPPPEEEPDAPDPAKQGLCNAYANNAGQAQENGRAFQDLAAAAGVDQSVEDFCAGATPGRQ